MPVADSEGAESTLLGAQSAVRSINVEDDPPATPCEETMGAEAAPATSSGPGAPSVPIVRRPIVDRRAKLMVGLAAALGLASGGLALALRQANGTAVDVAITRSIQWIDNPAFSALMVAISSVGYAPWSWLMLGCAIVALVAAGLYREVPFVLVTEGAGLLAASVKVLVERPRPAGDSIRVFSAVLDYSYPSGHVVSYTCLYGFLFFLVYVLFKRSWLRTVALTALAAMVGLVGISRIHLGHHWASDVLGGYALGTAYLLILVVAYRLLVVRPRTDRQAPATSAGGAGSTVHA